MNPMKKHLLVAVALLLSVIGARAQSALFIYNDGSGTPNAGTYVISNTISGPTTSVISDSFGHTFAIPEADYTITMIPEPATWVVPTLGLIALAFSQRRRVATPCRAS